MRASVSRTRHEPHRALPIASLGHLSWWLPIPVSLLGHRGRSSKPKEGKRGQQRTDYLLCRHGVPGSIRLIHTYYSPMQLNIGDWPQSNQRWLGPAFLQRLDHTDPWRMPKIVTNEISASGINVVSNSSIVTTNLLTSSYYIVTTIVSPPWTLEKSYVIRIYLQQWRAQPLCVGRLITCTDQNSRKTRRASSASNASTPHARR